MGTFPAGMDLIPWSNFIDSLKITAFALKKVSFTTKNAVFKHQRIIFQEARLLVLSKIPPGMFIPAGTFIR